MKRLVLRCLTAIGLVFACSLAHATVLVWTNTTGGDWNNANNWFPNQIPVAGDDVVITNSGTYNVTNNLTLTLDSLTLGANSGTQTLTGNSLTLTNASVIASNGVFDWSGGDLEGSLTVAPGGLVTMSNTIYFSENNSASRSNTAAMTNYGSVVCSANVYGYGNNAGVGGGLIVNAGLWQMAAPADLLNQSSPSNAFLNIGTLEQTTPSSAAIINWNFTCMGTISTPSGQFTLNWTGASTVQGSVNLTGSTILSAPITLASNAAVILNGGDVEGSITVEQGATLTVSNTLYFSENNSASRSNTATLTNYGTVVFAGNLYGYGNNAGAGGGLIENAGLWEMLSAAAINNQSSPSNTFVNTGTLEETAASGTSTIAWNFFNSGGTISTAGGAFDMGNWLGGGLIYGNALFSGGTISGTLASGGLINFSANVLGALTISANAQANWSDGDLEGSITVLPGGTLTLSNNIIFSENNSSTRSNTAAMTNYGTVILSGNMYGYGNNAGAGGGLIVNAGMWEALRTGSINNQSSPSNSFINAGTLFLTNGTGPLTIGWTFFNNGGTVTNSGGSFNMSNWTNSGVVYGSAVFSGGTISGTLASGDVMTLGSVTINGALTVASGASAAWNGGDLEGSLTVQSGGTLTLTNQLYFAENNSASRASTATMTNFGTVIWYGNINGNGNGAGAGGGTILNAGLWEAATDNSMNNQTSPSNTFINTGELEKTGGTSVSSINWNFVNTGSILSLAGTFSLNFAGPSTLNGTLNVSGGTISNQLTIASNAVLNLSGGDLEGSIIVLPGGKLTISNTLSFAQNNNSTHSNIVTLTNYGTVIWSGNINGDGNGSGAGGGLIYNAGVWDAVSASTLANQSSPSNFFINAGTLEQTGGTGLSTINWNFNNTGAIETPVGQFALNWFGPSTIQGTFTLASGTISVPLTLVSNAVMNLAGGDLEDSLTILAGATLSISNTFYLAENNYNVAANNLATLTNYGTVIWGATINGSGNSTNHNVGGIIYNAGLWESVAANQMGNYGYAGTNTFFNTGTLEQTAGSGTTSIGWNFVNNGGILGSQTNTISLTGAYNLTGGTLNFGLNNASHFGVITLAGTPAVLGGAVTANLNNGYVPATGAVFPVLTYFSLNGGFTNSNLPSPVAWQTNYGSSAFTLTVLNVRPTLDPLANQTVDELIPLAVYANAVDPDNGQTLTFGLASAPAGMTIAPTTGVISWTPAQNESPSTNTVLVTVTDNGTPSLAATNSFQVVVVEVNVAPELPEISHVSVNEQALLTVTNTAVESNLHAVTTGYGLVTPPGGMSISASGVITWTPAPAQSPGTYFITTIVTNTDAYDVVNPNLTASNTFAVVVNDVNSAPLFPPPANQSVNEQTLLTVTNAATAANIHATLTYALVGAPTNMQINAGGVITWRPAPAQSPGTNLITTVATATDPFDMVNPALSATNTFTVVVNEVNVAPVLPEIPAQTVREFSALTVTNTAVEANIHAVLAYGLVGAPANMTINPTNGIINWTPAQNQSPGTNLITTIVTNTDSFDLVNPHLYATNTFTVVVIEANLPPVLPAIPSTNTTVGTLLTITNTATEPNLHATVSYALISPPAGAAIDTNGVFTWTPSPNQSPSTNLITVVAISTDLADTNDPIIASVSTFTVSVSGSASLNLNAIANQTVNVGQTVSFTAVATGSDTNHTLAYSLESAPTGATIDPVSGAFSWRPPVASANSSNFIVVEVTANTTPATQATQSFAIAVNALTAVTLNPPAPVSTNIQILVAGPIGPDYILQAVSALGATAWTNLLTNTPTTASFTVTDTNAAHFTTRFYRIQLGP